MVEDSNGVNLRCSAGDIVKGGERYLNCFAGLKLAMAAPPTAFFGTLRPNVESSYCRDALVDGVFESFCRNKEMFHCSSSS